MYYVIPVVTGVLCLTSMAILLEESGKDKAKGKVAGTKKVAKAEIDETIKNKSIYPRSMWIYSIIMICITLGISVLFCVYYQDNSVFTSLKRVGLLAIIWPLAYTDYKEYRIPNTFILLGLIYRAMLIPFELLFVGTAMRYDLLSEVVAAAALLLAAGLCTVCMKNSVGYGDMKLFIIMGLLLSMDGIWGAIFLSLIISFFVSLYVLITKKKTRKDVIPFAPAIVIGTFLSVALSGV